MFKYQAFSSITYVMSILQLLQSHPQSFPAWLREKGRLRWNQSFFCNTANGNKHETVPFSLLHRLVILLENSRSLCGGDRDGSLNFSCPTLRFSNRPKKMAERKTICPPIYLKWRPSTSRHFSTPMPPLVLYR